MAGGAAMIRADRERPPVGRDRTSAGKDRRRREESEGRLNAVRGMLIGILVSAAFWLVMLFVFAVILQHRHHA